MYGSHLERGCYCYLLPHNGMTQQEREVMNSLYETLKEHQQHVTHWCYGHFHQSWHSTINGVLFKMLDIMELIELTP